jgi:hypothetical protein
MIYVKKKIKLKIYFHLITKLFKQQDHYFLNKIFRSFIAGASTKIEMMNAMMNEITALPKKDVNCKGKYKLNQIAVKNVSITINPCLK